MQKQSQPQPLKPDNPILDALGRQLRLMEGIHDSIVKRFNPMCEEYSKIHDKERDKWHKRVRKQTLAMDKCKHKYEGPDDWGFDDNGIYKRDKLEFYRDKPCDKCGKLISRYGYDDDIPLSKEQREFECEYEKMFYEKYPYYTELDHYD